MSSSLDRVQAAAKAGTADEAGDKSKGGDKSDPPEITTEERERRWRQLADMYLAQQLSCYPPDYLQSNPTPERMLETVERFEEDLTDRCRRYAPMTAKVRVGEDACPFTAGYWWFLDRNRGRSRCR